MWCVAENYSWYKSSCLEVNCMSHFFLMAAFLISLFFRFEFLLRLEIADFWEGNDREGGHMIPTWDCFVFLRVVGNLSAYQLHTWITCCPLNASEHRKGFFNKEIDNRVFGLCVWKTQVFIVNEATSSECLETTFHIVLKLEVCAM